MEEAGRGWGKKGSGPNAKKLFRARLIRERLLRSLVKAGVNVKAVLRSLNTASLPISRFKRH